MTVAAMLVAGCADKSTTVRGLVGADPERGRRVAEAAGCAACHQIPGIDWPQGRVGGTLAGFGARAMIAGRFANQPETLVLWLRDPPALAPDTGMPPTGLNEADARDVAAYLYRLDE
jgi:cytochrome c2